MLFFLDSRKNTPFCLPDCVCCLYLFPLLVQYAGWLIFFRYSTRGWLIFCLMTLIASLALTQFFPYFLESGLLRAIAEIKRHLYLQILLVSMNLTSFFHCLLQHGHIQAAADFQQHISHTGETVRPLSCTQKSDQNIPKTKSCRYMMLSPELLRNLQRFLNWSSLHKYVDDDERFRTLHCFAGLHEQSLDIPHAPLFHKMREQ